jgi:hypothetical protein
MPGIVEHREGLPALAAPDGAQADEPATALVSASINAFRCGSTNDDYGLQLDRCYAAVDAALSQLRAPHLLTAHPLGYLAHVQV